MLRYALLILGESYKFVLTDGRSRPMFLPICQVEDHQTRQFSESSEYVSTMLTL